VFVEERVPSALISKGDLTMRRFLILICCLFFTFPSFAQDTEVQEPTSLLQIHYALQTIDDLEARGILSQDEAEAQRAYYLQAAETLTGETLSREEISARAFESDSGILRFFSFVNVLWALASLIIVLSLGWLFVMYIVPLLKRVPMIVYEILLYLLAFAFIWNGQFATEGAAQFVALPGVLGLGILFPVSYVRRVMKKPKRSFEFHRNALVILFLGLSVIWGFVAIRYQSELIGFLTVLSAIWTLTLTRWVRALLAPFGYEKENPLIEIMAMAFGLLALHLFAEIRGLSPEYNYFALGVHWLGTYGYFAALEVMASKWRNGNQPMRYIYWQLFAIFSAVVGLYIGIYWQIGNLSETAGTFLLIYTLTKYIELPNWRRHWAWASLGLGLLLYVFSLLITQYPQFFLLA
jgi:hypothetical protein